MLATGEILLDTLDDYGHLKNLFGVRPLRGLDLEHLLDQHAHVHRVVAGNGRVLALEHALEQAIHVIGLEGRLQMAHLVGHAAERPDVRLEIVRLILPHLGASVVRRAGLRVQEALLRHLADIQIAQFRGRVLVEEDIGALHVPMQYVERVQVFEPGHDLDHRLPYVLLLVILLIVLIFAYALENVAVVGELHDDAERVARLVEERLLVPRHKRIFNRRKYPDFV